jgi:hypothetical protein
MTVPLPLQIIWTKTTTGVQTLGSELQASVVTALTAEGWTNPSGSTYLSPSNIKGQAMRVTLSNSTAQLDVTAEEDDGTVVTSRSFDVAGGVQEIHASPAGLHIQRGGGEKLWTFIANLENEPAALPAQGMVYIAAHRLDAQVNQWGTTGVIHGLRNPTGGAFGQRVACNRTNMGGGVVDLRYPDGSRRYPIPFMQAQDDATNLYVLGGFIPGCVCGDELIVDGTTGISVRVDVGVDGTFECMRHTIHSVDVDFKYLLRTA